MEIKSELDIENYLDKYLLILKNDFLNSYIYKYTKNWKIRLTNNLTVASTACLMLDRDTGRYTIYFNEDFLKENIKNEKQLFFVFLHELFHKIEGDLLREAGLFYHFVPETINLIFDIRINSIILKKYFKEGWHFLNEFYKDTDNVFCFLLSPCFTFKDVDDIFKNGDKQGKIIEMIKKKKFKNEEIIKDKEGLAKWYVEAWFKEKSLYNLFIGLRDILKLNLMQPVFFLGDHTFNDNKFVHSKIKKDDEEIKRNDAETIIQALKNAFEDDANKTVNDRCLSTKYGILPAFGRREFMMLYKKKYPFFFPNVLDDFFSTYKKVNLYIDVSGSMDNCISFVYKLVLSAKEYLSDPVYLLSGEIIEIKLAELMKWKVKTNYATNFDKALQHSIEKKFQKLLIITDGIGFINPQLAGEIKQRKMDIYVILVNENFYLNNPWENITKKYWTLQSY
ncbi:MAG: hypothetical protein KA120_05875 [Candidatus Goldbacteria bacterium]|nr:hypothetical protein [Candidatus Goldiibacteriota bacterium]